MDDSKVLVVIPLYNHAASVGNVIVGVRSIHENVLVVDDGSTDGGGEVVAGLGVRLIKHRENKGKGAAIMTAVAEAKKEGMTHIVTIDADGQHDPSDMPNLLKVAKENPLAIVVGKRDFKNATVPGSSRFGRTFSNFWLRLQTGRSLGDTQSGFRVYPLRVLEGLNLKEAHFSFEIEALVRAAWGGIDLCDAPISVYYPPPSERISHFNMWKDNLRLTRLNTRLTLRSLVPWPHRHLVKKPDKSERVSVLRPLSSIRLLLTQNTNPTRLAVAGAVGVALGAAPLIGCHTVVILFACGYMGLNKVSAVATSQLCMPPIVPALCIETGYFIRHKKFLLDISMETLGYQALDRLWEWLLGSLIIGPVLGALVGGVIYVLALLLMGNWGAQENG